ncbi:MAG TPA: UpxY family transcription antiterminator [Ferruginibacter sp.]|jgi:transcription antitermination factor NusG|nr:UpxY family transcription antiterminator [Ferruginibacter sp.]
MSENNLYWFAVYTRPRWEKKVVKLLNEKNIENYCPLNKVVKQWSDRKKVVLEPIFKSYIFVRVTEEDKWGIKKINGILNFVYWLGKPARIRDEEISVIKKFLNEFSDIAIEQDLQVNAKVRIKQGALMNYQGLLLEISGNRVKIKIESMGLQLSAYFDKKNIERLPGS